MNQIYLEIRERIEQYNKKFPSHPPLSGNDRWIVGAWHFHRSRKGQLYGSYPDGYLKRIYALFLECKDILHLFSGSLEKDEKGIRFDISSQFNPDVVGDVLNIKEFFAENSFDLIIADPPYEKRDFEIYGCKPFNKREVIKSLSEIVKPKGYLVWLDLVVAPFSNKYWEWVGLIAFSQGVGMRVRGITILRKR